MNDGTKIVVDEKQIDEKLYNSLLEFRDLKYETIRKNYFKYYKQLPELKRKLQKLVTELE